MEKTIIERMCDISETMRNPDAGRRRRIELSDENLKKAGEDIGALRDTLGLNTMQVLIMTAVMENSSRCHIDCDDVADYLGLEYLKFLTYYKDLDDLKSRGYLRMKNDGGIVLPSEVMCAFKENRAIEPEKTTGLDTAALLSRIRRKLGFLGEDLISQREFVESIHSLMQGNPDTSIAKAYRKYCLNICYAERVFFFAVLKRYYSDDDDQVGWYDIGDLFDEEDTDDLRCALNHEVMELQSKGVIEFAGEDGMKTKEFFKIKDNVKDEALADVGGIRKKTVRVSASRKITAASIRPKELFYNPGVQRQVGQLHELMGEKRFAGIRAALQDKGLRTGFTCLFYGAPGTGKTETVYQIARECGRDLFVVDVAQIKSCWVGESEKNIREVFTRYRASLKGEGVAPILLFNEADAIFSKRLEDPRDSVDQMMNAIQNICLDALENLEGILIATTNLASNFCDDAFARRFLFKVEFDKPEVPTRAKIWQAMVDGLSEEDALVLAERYDFSGGNVENVARKAAVGYVLSGQKAGLDALMGYCDEEMLSSAKSARKIGFQSLS